MHFSIRKSVSSRSLFHNYLFAFLLGFGALLIVYLPAAVSAGTGTPIWVQTSSGHMPFIS